MFNESKNQTAWVKLFERYSIIDQINKNGLFFITSEKINEFRESRLMTKFDNESQLPEILFDEKITILPTSRGSYALGRFEIFHKFEKIAEQTFHYNFQNTYESLDFNNINTESLAISCAYASKILEHFVGEELMPTVSGRMSSNSFDFDVNDKAAHTHQIHVDKAQIEIDGGFEGATSLVLIEAKNFISNDFIVRQLYYPFRRWNGSISKKIRNIYLTYSNGVFELREYEFANFLGYNSIQLVKSERYSIYSYEINIESIQNIMNTTKVGAEPQTVPFPQADAFERVVNLCELLNANEFILKVDITENYGFDSRQTDYYLNACCYLGLADSSKNDQGDSVGVLTEKGGTIFSKDINERRMLLIEAILAKNAFRETLKLYFSKAEMPNREEIVRIMRNSNLYRVGSDSTYERRASTISGWINWVVNQLEE